MSRIYDNWEKLATAVVRREQLRELCYATSMSSRASVSTCPSPVANHSQVESNSANVDNSQALKPDEVYVNSKPLDSRELAALQTCSNPPRKLRPGSYWYDKYTGFWGKQGQKPSQIISANLDVGYRLDLLANATNTNTLVFINGREITKVELRVLKLVGVKCPRDTHFWMYEDGSYEEEANVPIKKGSIWRKPGMKMLCSLFSLPFPPKLSLPSRSGELSVPNHDEQGDLKKLLLIGCSRSGTSTIFKQAKILYKDVPFSENELYHTKLQIWSNLCSNICIILEARLQFEVESVDELRQNQSSDEQWIAGHSDTVAETLRYSLSPRLKAFSGWLLHPSESLDFSSISFIQQYAHLILELWEDPAFQESLKRTSEMDLLPANAYYFLQRAVDIFNPNYEPSNMDILRHKEYHPWLLNTDFSFTLPHHDDIEYEDKLIRYQLISAQTRGFEDNLEWLKMFGGVQIVIFSISLTDYDQPFTEHGGNDNKMMLNKRIFESVVTHPSVDHTPVLLLLTNYDLFEEKIMQSPLDQCDWFHEFQPITVAAGNGNMAEKAFHYISVKFKNLYASATGRKLYVTKVNCFEQDSVAEALNYAREIVKWDEEMNGYLLAADYSSSEEDFDSEEYQLES